MAWKCEACGFEKNEKMFCDQCGALLGAKALKRPEPPKSLAEAKSRKEAHGRLLSCEYSGWSSGMMMNSYRSSSWKLTRESGSPQLIVTDLQQNTYKNTAFYRADEALFQEAEALIRQENLASWEGLQEIPEKRMQIMDYSGGANVTLSFDDHPGTQFPPVIRTVNCTAAEHHGGGDVILRLRTLLQSAARPECFVSEKKETMEDPGPGFFMGMGMGAAGKQVRPQETPAKPAPAETAPDGSWTCPMCHAEGNTGKFCFNCGALRP